MPAVSKSQQHLMGMVHAYKQGKLDTSGMSKSLLAKIRKIAHSISGKAAKDFAKTKTKNLPVHESVTFKEYLSSFSSDSSS